ncbi:hypothetical protein PPMP20_19835 [Paraburkholderia phymatum]|uniref:hypothetical protein n=1 Tax=Paraburkholderia phymatum TaxID=148447 RepID=UPI0012FDB433|nr:hypothetical protein [Paraburkholderia phymatum]
MGKYPSTRLNKAALKFRRQGRKKSQNVSVEISDFFLLLVGNYCWPMRNDAAFCAAQPWVSIESPAYGARCAAPRVRYPAVYLPPACGMSIFIPFIFNYSSIDKLVAN